jgi:hypothetical protein
MAKIAVILARPDSNCGKVFHPDRRAAEEQRIVLEVWNRATGRNRERFRLAVFQCTRCGGFHVGQRRADKTGARVDDFSDRVVRKALNQKARGYLDDREPFEDCPSEDESEPNPIASGMSAIAQSLGTDFQFEHRSSTSLFAL